MSVAATVTPGEPAPPKVRVDLRQLSTKVMPQLPDLPELRAEALRTWRGRMVNEYCSGDVFEVLGQQMAAAGFPASEVAECEGFAAEERRHGVLCGAVVEALGGSADFERPAMPDMPSHADATPLEGVLRSLISISCMAETVAVALVGAERLEMPEGELRKLLSEILGDEVGHARFGWRVVSREVPKLDAAAKDRLSRYLMLAFADLEHHELTHIPNSAATTDGEHLGICEGRAARTLLYETIDQVIIVGLERLGLQAKRAWQHRNVASTHVAAATN